MEYMKIEKRCPFCPDASWAHLYKTYHGLYRHIWNEHVFGAGDKLAKEGLGQVKVEKIRVFTVRYSEYYDVPVTGSGHVNALIDAYCSGEWNPSLRGAGDIDG